MTIHEFLEKQIAEAGLSMRKASLEIGQNRNYLSNVIKNKQQPSFGAVQKLSERLGFSLEQAAGYDIVERPMKPVTTETTMTLSGAAEVDRQAERLLASVTEAAHHKLIERGLLPSIETMIVWWHRNNGRLDDYERVREHFDRMYVPDSNLQSLEAVEMGAKSLATRELTNADPAKLRQFMEALAPKKRRQIIYSYHEAAKENQPRHSLQTIEGQDVETGRPITLQYYRIILPVTDAQNNRWLLNYSKQIESKSC